MTDYHLSSILLVEDDPDDIELFETALNSVSPGTKLFSAKSCKLALQYLNMPPVSRPDVIFMDLRLGEIDGYECIAILKNREDYKDVPVIVLSTSVPMENIDQLYSLGVHYFIIKPATYAKLKEVIDKMVNTPAMYKSRSRESFHIQYEE